MTLCHAILHVAQSIRILDRRTHICVTKMAVRDRSLYIPQGGTEEKLGG